MSTVVALDFYILAGLQQRQPINMGTVLHGISRPCCAELKHAMRSSNTSYWRKVCTSHRALCRWCFTPAVGRSVWYSSYGWYWCFSDHQHNCDRAWGLHLRLSWWGLVSKMTGDTGMTLVIVSVDGDSWSRMIAHDSLWGMLVTFGDQIH